MTSLASWRVERYEALASTSDLCVDRARAGELGRLMVIAARQTAGRGRAGRAWSSPAGNFCGSVLLRPATPANRSGLFALLSGLSLLEALSGFLPDASPLTLKWPNDVMAGPAKLAGVLLDAAIEADSITWLVIGFGINLVAAPVVPGRQTVSVAALGGSVAPDMLAERLCARLDHWQASLAADDGHALRAAWAMRAHPPGTAITVDGGRISGVYQGIDAGGSLLLRQGDGVTTIRSGDVALL